MRKVLIPIIVASSLVSLPRAPSLHAQAAQPRPNVDAPRGEYTLFLLPGEDGGELILSDETRQWGTDYDPTRDLGRTSVRRRELPETLQRVEYATDWRMLWP